MFWCYFELVFLCSCVCSFCSSFVVFFLCSFLFFLLFCSFYILLFQWSSVAFQFDWWLVIVCVIVVLIAEQEVEVNHNKELIESTDDCNRKTLGLYVVSCVSLSVSLFVSLFLSSFSSFLCLCVLLSVSLSVSLFSAYLPFITWFPFCVQCMIGWCFVLQLSLTELFFISYLLNVIVRLS